MESRNVANDSTSLNIVDSAHPSVLTLIPDILSYIFLLCLPYDRHPEAKVDEAPLNVSQVCQVWRNIALSTLQLWAKLRIVIQPHPQTVPKHALPILMEWLRRSETADIWITIEWPKPRSTMEENGRLHFPAYGVTSAHIYSLFSEICKHWKRVRGLILTLPDDHLDDSVDTINTKLLALDALDLRYYRAWRAGRGHPVLDHHFVPLFRGLKELSIDSEVTFQIRSEDLPACPALKKLSLLHHSVSADNAIRFLQGCPLLEELHFSPPDTSGWGVTPLPAFNPNLVRTTFTSICILDISGDGQYTFIIGSLLDRLDLPHLRKLDLTFGEEWPFSGTQSWPHLVHFLMRSNPPLESLTLVNDWMSSKEVMDSLELLPALKSLKIRFTQEIATALCFPATGEAVHAKARFCPLLELIEFINIASEDLSNAAKMVQEISNYRTSSDMDYSPLKVILTTRATP